MTSSSLTPLSPRAAKFATLPRQEQARLLIRWKTLYHFCHEVLGFKDLISVEEEVLPDYSHEHFCQWMQTEPGPFKLILQPRYTFKSHIGTIGKTLFDLVADDNLRLLLISDTNDKSEGFLEGIKNHLEGKVAGSRFQEIYGDWTVESKKGVWNQEAITIRPRTEAHVEPTISTAGIETSKTGKHYDKIIADDLVSEKNVTTTELIEKTKDVYRKYLSVLRPGGEMILIGTRWNFDDLYGFLLAEEARLKQQGEPPVFATYIRQAEVDGQYPFAKIGLTKAFLAHQRSQQGSYIYSCLYQNDPVSNEQATFKAEDFTFYDPGWRQNPEWVNSLYITACLDPATGEGEDNAALSVMGADAEMNLYLLELVSGKLSTSEQVEATLRLHAKWGFRVYGIETNSFQKMVKEALDYRVEELRKRNPAFRMFHIESFTSSSTNSKDMRIRGLQPWHERHALRLPGTSIATMEGPYQRLVHQMLHYAPSHRPLHEDELDAVSFHPGIQQRGSTTPQRVSYPYTSAAWYERELQKESVSTMARRPRWQRQAIPELSLS